MIFGYFNLIIAFIILGAILLLMLVNLNLKNKIKFILIPFIIWYGLALYYVPTNLMGWSVRNEPPDKSIIISAYVIEPSSIVEGGIYFWIIDYERKDKQSLNPQDFSKLISQEPRCYVIPYDRELHKQLLKAQEGALKKKSYLQYHRERRKGSRQNSEKWEEGREKDDLARFRLLDLRKLLPKENEDAVPEG